MNSLQTFIAHTPQFPLSQYINCLWYIKGKLPYNREKILPTGTIELIFNLGSPYKLIDKVDPGKFALNKNSWICGLQTEYIISESHGNTNALGVSFKPGGAYPFFKFPLSELNNRVVDMDLIWGSLAEELREKLAETKLLNDKFKLLENALLEKLKADLYGLEIIQYAVDNIIHPNGFRTIKDLSTEIGYSQKHLINQFHKTVGVSPKILARVFKFLKVLNAINPARQINWAEIAYECDYYDQAHFNKDFLAFSGLNPTTYLKLRKENLPENLKAGPHENFVPIC